MSTNLCDIALFSLGAGVSTKLVIMLDEIYEELMNKRQPITITTLSTRTGLSKRVCWQYLDIRSA